MCYTIFPLLQQSCCLSRMKMGTSLPVYYSIYRMGPTEKRQYLWKAKCSLQNKELAPLVFHLRYFAQPNELLIIDEPEMNLHPKAQVQVLEFLAMLVNAGLNLGTKKSLMLLEMFSISFG